MLVQITYYPPNRDDTNFTPDFRSHFILSVTIHSDDNYFFFVLHQ